jgi:hypothetical protein
VADDAARLNDITSRFRDAGFDLRLYESIPGVWEAIWHPHEGFSGLTSSTGRSGGTTTGVTIIEAAEGALRELEHPHRGEAPAA